MLKIWLHFFPVASDLRFLLLSNFPGAIMRSSLMTLTQRTCIYLALKINFPLLFWLNYLKCYKGFFGRVMSRVPHVFHSVNLYGTDCRNFILVIVALSSIAWILLLKTGLAPWLNCFRLLERQTDCQ